MQRTRERIFAYQDAVALPMEVAMIPAVKAAKQKGPRDAGLFISAQPSPFHDDADALQAVVLHIERQRADQAMVLTVAQFSSEHLDNRPLKIPVPDPDARTREERGLRTSAELKRKVARFQLQ